MILDVTFTVTEAEAGHRLDSVLCARFPASCRACCRRAIETRQVRVNGQPARKGVKVRAGSAIRVLRLTERADQRVRPDAAVPVRILFEDQALLAADKPAGMPVHPLSGDETGTLMNGLVARYPELAAVGDPPLMAGALHRIDTGTSGVVLVARSAAAFDAVRAQFTEQSVEKIYLALVEGHVALPGHLVHGLAHQPGLPYCKMTDARALSGPQRVLHAETAYRPLGWHGRDTLLEVTIRTGVTHQIRCQLALNGMPIVGDTLYGARAMTGGTRFFLHAREIRFRHPQSHLPCVLQAPLAPDLQARLAET